ncbi:hypothetical protein F5884DRAFT_682796 [Xylogone sp. PMI_703]|nr:hypothetical protein F5884DRAFT_682796 [Xylogone sp. PMI_703]
MAHPAAYRTVAFLIISSILLLYLVSLYRDRDDGDRQHPIGIPEKEINDIIDSNSAGTPNLEHEDVQHHELFNTPVPIATNFPEQKVSPSTNDLKVSSSPILRVGEALESKPLTSPSGRYRFSLKDSGDLSLIFMVTGEELFSSDTKFYWPVKFHAELNPNGILELSWHNETAQPYRGKPWVSSMFPNCDGIDPENDEGQPFLELQDSGLLQIRNEERIICTLHKAIKDRGRLAIIYTGYLRTYFETCEGHHEKLVKPWSGAGGVDVHIFTYLEEVFHENGEELTKDAIEENLRTCFGSTLKTLNILHTNEVSERWNDAPQAVVSACGQAKLDRHISQFKTIYLAGLQVQKYMIQTGVQYDYIMKARLDLLLHGSIPRLDTLDAYDGKIILPRVAMDWTWHTLFHDGTLHAGTTDITAFGKASSMWTYLAFYREMKNLLTIEKGEKESVKWPSINTHGTRKVAVNDAESCTPENALGYWLGLNGIKVQTEWRFEMGLLRRDGELVFTCPEKERKWMCPGL